MTRLMCMVFWGPSRVEQPEKVHEAPLTMTLPVLILGFLSLIAGATLWIPMPIPMWVVGLVVLLVGIVMLFINSSAARLLGLFGLFAGGILMLLFNEGKLPKINVFETYLAPVLYQGQSHWMHYIHPEGHDYPSVAAIWTLTAIGTAAAVIGALIAWSRYSNGPADATVKPLAKDDVAWTRLFDRIYNDVFGGGIAVISIAWRSTVEAFNKRLPQWGHQSLVFLSEGMRAYQPARLRVSLLSSVIGGLVLVLWVLRDLVF